MELNNELAKYEEELGRVKTELGKIDTNREALIKHGLRIEGIVAFLREQINSASAVKAEPVEASAN